MEEPEPLPPNEPRLPTSTAETPSYWPKILNESLMDSSEQYQEEQQASSVEQTPRDESPKDSQNEEPLKQPSRQDLKNPSELEDSVWEETPREESEWGQSS